MAAEEEHSAPVTEPALSLEKEVTILKLTRVTTSALMETLCRAPPEPLCAMHE